MKKLRILLADDHEMLRRGLRATLTEQPGWEICGEAVNGRQAVDLARQLRPDVVVMDLAMPELNGLEATRQIRRALPRTEVLVLTFDESEALVREVLKAGARGYVLKNDLSRVLVQAVENLSLHRPYFTSKVAEGRSTKEVAEVLQISAKTAENHRTNLMRKLKIKSATELVRYALRNKIITA